LAVFNLFFAFLRVEGTWGALKWLISSNWAVMTLGASFTPMVLEEGRSSCVCEPIASVAWGTKLTALGNVV